MLKRKSIAVLLLSGVLALSLAACSEDGANTPDSSAAGDTPAQSSSSTAEDENTVFTEPEIGGNSILSQDTLGGYTAELEILNIKSLPDDDRKAYTGESVLVKLTDSSGNSAETGLNNGSSGEFSSAVWEDCAENALKLFEVEQNGEKKYILMVYTSYGTENGAYDYEEGTYHAQFIVCDLDAAEDGELRPYEIKLSPYVLNSPACDVSPEFAYKEGTTFTDPALGFEIEFDTETYKAVVTQL